MTSAIQSWLAAVPNNPWSNLVLFTVPVINMLYRNVKEKENYKASQQKLSYMPELALLIAERAAFQNEYLCGFFIQCAVAGVLSKKILSSPPRSVGAATLCLFAIFSINAAVSPLLHFYEANWNLELKRA